MTANQLIKRRIGVSACLLGHEVRYDGEHKKNDWLTSVLIDQYDFVPVCPEMAIGLGVPRPPIELTGTIDEVRAVGVENRSMDVTQALGTYAQQTAAVSTDLCGFIFKGKSPSCGLNTRLNGEFMPHPVKGVFSQVIHERLPLLPIVEIETLESAEMREMFLSCVEVYQQWQSFAVEGIPAEVVKEFHLMHRKLQFEASDEGN